MKKKFHGQIRGKLMGLKKNLNNGTFKMLINIYKMATTY